MCGIAGIVGDDALNNNSCCTDIQKSLKHRGPDDDGIYINENAILIHTRLSVIDTEKGHQPMTCSRYTIVYNGELYNTPEIRNILLAKGYDFRTHSDTEVVLKSFIEWGEECVNYLNGIFAFAIWDTVEKCLYFARDRMGVKPFFYFFKNERFVFSSEIKGLLKSPDISPSIDINSIAEIMLIGPGRTIGYGVFKEISELPPAYCGTFKDGKIRIRKYWELRDIPFNDTLEETEKRVKYLINDAIVRQTVSDVPLGTFLSGGLDSSIISAVAAREFKRQGKILDTFSVRYKDNDLYFKADKFQPDSDNEYIEAMVEHIGSNHHFITIDTPQLVEALYMSVDARDLPGMADVDASMLLFCKEVKKYCKTALSGECADEIFGGYPWYRDKTIRMTEGFPWSQSTAYRMSFIKDEFADKINPSQYVYSKYLNTISSADIADNLSPLEKRMREMMKLNLDWFMQTLLDRKDRMSMYNGLEVRVPFCDYRIVEYMYSCPWEYKNYMNREKGLLRKAVSDLLPDKVLWRKKSPYPKTFNPSYLKAVKERLSDIISNPYAPILDLLKKSELLKIIESSDDNPVRWYGQLMTTPQTIAYFIQLNYWLEKYNVKIRL